MPIHSREAVELTRLFLIPVYARPGAVSAIPKDQLPEDGLDPRVAYQLLHDELMIDGNSRQNLATSVTTFMDDEAGRLFAETLDKGLIDEHEYPQTAAIGGQCVRIISELWNSRSHENATASGGLVAPFIGPDLAADPGHTESFRH